MTHEISHWPRPRSVPRLLGDEVHIWQLSLTQPPGVLARLAATLSAVEHERANRFRFEEHRWRFIAGRGQVRQLLARYLAIAPETLSFQYGEYGKPYLEQPLTEGQQLCFNVSHSGDMALCAVAIDREVGVDLETINRAIDHQQIVQRFFSPMEQAALEALPSDQRRAAFFAGWTRKEAYLKAKGSGLALALDQFSVSLSPNDPAELQQVVGQPNEPQRWTIRSLDIGSVYAACVVAKGQNWRFYCWQYPPNSG